MGAFGSLALLVGAGFLAAAFMRQKLVGTEEYRNAMTLFFAGLILHDLASAIPYMGVVAVPLGYGLLLWCFRDVCLAIANSGRTARGETEEY